MPETEEVVDRVIRKMKRIVVHLAMLERELVRIQELLEECRSGENTSTIVVGSDDPDYLVGPFGV